jgi:hypothetical protein
MTPEEHSFVMPDGSLSRAHIKGQMKPSVASLTRTTQRMSSHRVRTVGERELDDRRDGFVHEVSAGTSRVDPSVPNGRIAMKLADKRAANKAAHVAREAKRVSEADAQPAEGTAGVASEAHSDERRP